MQEQKTKIQNFTDLDAWKAGHALAVSVYQLTKKFPKDELFGITNQMRRAAVSVTSNIAEGFSRSFPKEKTQFYSIAKGSLTELESQMLISRDVGLISAREFSDVEQQIRQTNKLLTGLLRYTRTLHEKTV
ncbi:MAG: four helix bundle protein [bacterium]|nr:four helix bundle protein [bacterium]